MNPVKSGALKKKSGWNWKNRWFVLQGSRLFYFRNEHSALPSTSILLNSTVGIKRKKTNKKQYHFIIQDPRNKKVWFLESSSEKDMFEWITNIENAISNGAVSSPVTVEHKLHVNFNEETGFQGLPKHWEVLLQQSGLTAKDFGSIFFFLFFLFFYFFIFLFF